MVGVRLVVRVVTSRQRQWLGGRADEQVAVHEVHVLTDAVTVGFRPLLRLRVDEQLVHLQDAVAQLAAVQQSGVQRRSGHERSVDRPDNLRFILRWIIHKVRESRLQRIGPGEQSLHGGVASTALQLADRALGHARCGSKGGQGQAGRGP